MQVRPFHLILFWPLRIKVPPENDTGKAADFWAFIEERMRLDGQDWEIVPDPLFRDCGPVMHYQEAVYFHPFARKVIYAKPDRTGPVRLYRHTGIQAVEVEREGDEAKITLKVERLHLYVFDTQLAILVTEISHNDHLPLQTAMGLQNELRRIYPAGWSQNVQDESKQRAEMSPLHCPRSVRWLRSATPREPYERAPPSNYEAQDFYLKWLKINHQPAASSHWTALLPAMEPFEGWNMNEGKGYHLLGDDRMAAMAFFGLPDPRGISDADMIRIGLADGPGSWLMPYAPGFLADFDTKYCYDRFWTRREPDKYPDFTTRYMCSGWAFSGLADSGAWVFPELLAYFRHHYFQMGLLIYLQYSSLLIFSDRLSEAVSHARSDQKRYRELIDRAATDFAIFSDRYWLTDVSNQVQGQELYDLWVRRLRLRELFGQVRDEVHDVNEILESQAQVALAQGAHNLSRVGFPLLVLSVLFGFWGSNWVEKWKDDWRWYVGSSAVAALAFAVFWLVSRKRRAAGRRRGWHEELPG